MRYIQYSDFAFAGFRTRRAATTLALAVSTALTGCFLDSGGGDSGASASTGTPASSNSPGTPTPSPSPSPAPGTGVMPPPNFTPPGGNMPGDVQAQPTSAGDARRFMEQSTFGPTTAGVQDVMQKGAALALAEQFVKPATTYAVMPAVDVDPRKQCPDNNAVCLRDGYSAQPLQRALFANAIAGQDQLRQRVAFALSQIIVVSANTIDPAYAMRNFQQILMQNAFGNFKDILMAATLSPVMGAYLNMVDNVKADPVKGTEPNENYARELLQLFSVGEFMLNPDGSRKLDGEGKPINTYDQDTIENFAKVFTGWTYPPRPGAVSRFPNPQFFEGNMVAFPAQHDTTAKTLLGGAVIPANQTPQKDVEDAVNNVFNHPNIGPYIGKQLIQFLVTSNPSPEYVVKVATAFNNNGQGVRGDMKAVLRTILLDPEARGDTKTDPNAGKLREPVLFMTNLLRSLGGTTDGVYLIDKSTAMGQPPFESPTVFNYFQPDYAPPGADVLGPEFKIMHTSTVLGRANFVHELLVTRNENVPPAANVTGATGTKTNSAALNGAAPNPATLVDQVTALFGNNSLSAQEKAAIVTAVTAVPAGNAVQRVRTAIYLVVTAAQVQVAK